MKCLKCDRLDADEINVSVNVSSTWHEHAEPDYTGDTDYGDHLAPIGTVCSDCGEQFTEAVLNLRELLRLPQHPTMLTGEHAMTFSDFPVHGGGNVTGTG